MRVGVGVRCVVGAVQLPLRVGVGAGVRWMDAVQLPHGALRVCVGVRWAQYHHTMDALRVGLQGTGCAVPEHTCTHTQDLSHTHARACTWSWSPLPACACNTRLTHMHAGTHERMHTCTRTYAHTHSHSHTRTHAHTHARTDTHGHTHTHAWTHTCTGPRVKGGGGRRQGAGCNEGRAQVDAHGLAPAPLALTLRGAARRCGPPPAGGEG